MRFINDTSGHWCSVVHVVLLIDGCWQLLHFHFKSALNLIKYSLVFFTWNEWNCQTLGSKSSCSTNTMKVLIGFIWHVEVEDDIDLLDIDTSSEEVSGNHDSILAFLEILVDLDSFTLLKSSMACNWWETFFPDNFIQFLSILLSFCKHNDLVEIQVIE